jgi:hypothetical protein
MMEVVIGSSRGSRDRGRGSGDRDGRDGVD